MKRCWDTVIHWSIRAQSKRRVLASIIEPAAAPVKAAQRRGKAAGTFLKKLLEYFCFANTGAQQSANWRLRAFRMACSQYHSSELPSRYDGTLGLWFVSAEGSTVQALHRKAVHGSRGWAACPCFFPVFFVDVMILSCVQFLAGVLNQRACYGHLWLSPYQHWNNWDVRVETWTVLWSLEFNI